MFWLTDKVRRNVLVSTDQGYLLVNRFDQGVSGQSLLSHGQAQTLDVDFCFESLTKRNNLNPVIFDIGAGTGTFTTWQAKVFGQSRIYCFEPQHAVFQLLAANVALNNLYNVRTYNLAIGAEHTRLEYPEPDYFAEHDFGKFSLTNNRGMECIEQTVSVEAITVDSFVELHKITSLDFLKITTNGMDVDVLRGAEQCLARFHPVIYMDYIPAGPDENRTDIVAILESHNYDFKGTDTHKILAV